MTEWKDYFPMLREQEEILAEIRGKKQLKEVFDSWTWDQQKEFLDCCTGVRGIHFLYDGFFKELMNPENAPERLNDFLSLLLGMQVKICKVLPNDSTRIADESSLLLTDIVVELEDGSLANVEVQKIGYKFPGQRGACYSADLLLRQYKRVRGERGKKFSYRDIRSVYTIVLIEKSTKEFHLFPKHYIHCFEQQSDTGLKLELLQKYIFVPIDIFKKNQQNKSIKGKLEAWLLFFCMDDPEEIQKLIEAYPEFYAMYKEAYELCQNMEVVMGIFSKELQELDRNTVQLMMDEMQEELEQGKAELEQMNVELKQTNAELEQMNVELKQTNAELEQKSVKLKQTNVKLEQTNVELEQTNVKLEQTNVKLEQTNVKLKQTNVELEQTNVKLEQTNAKLQEKESEIERLKAEKEEALRRLADLERRSLA